jgi:short-subunit dehydrogenase
MVTGASSGIGQATSLLLAALGHQVIAVGRRPERLAALQAQTEEMFGDIYPVEADVRDAEAMQRAVGLGLAHFGRLDVLVANAGVGHRGPLVEAKWEDAQLLLETNINGILHSVRACVPPMRASRGGHIIMINSILGAVPAPGAALYSMSKAALSALAQALRYELKTDGIWVTDVLVGQTHTEFAEKRLGKSGKVASKIPTMTPERVASQIVFAMERRRRTVIIRWFDRAFVVGGRFAPRLMDRILARVYLGQR